jgi:hypothetical protein
VSWEFKEVVSEEVLVGWGVQGSQVE